MRTKEKNDWPKKIIHIDMDAFFAAIEQRDNPAYRGKPVVVGGNPKSRGVVSTASYEARKFGIRSAMPAAQALRLCPHAIFLKPSFEKYHKESAAIMAVLRQHTDLVEPLSLDEAYLDVTRHKLQIQNPEIIASLIKQNIFAVTKLTASAGVAPNMFLAKIASDLKKPDGLVVIAADQVQEFLEKLPVRKIPGVGPVTEAALLKYGIRTCGDIAARNSHELYGLFGKWGVTLHQMALGKDERNVEPHGERKQYSAEETFEKDVTDLKWLKSKLKGIAEEVFTGLDESGKTGKTVTLKVKYFDFEQVTRSKTMGREIKSGEEIYQTAAYLLENKTKAGKKAVRLLGIGISGLKLPERETSLQKELF